MKDFFHVKTLDQVFQHITEFDSIGFDDISISDALNRIVRSDRVSDQNIPDFSRSTMDGYAVRASSTFGASEGNPAMLMIKGIVRMGEAPDISIGIGEAAKISTGGMLPKGADSVVMIEHTELLDADTLEVYRSVAPGHHVIQRGDDYKEGEILIRQGQRLRPQEIGLMAAFGKTTVQVFRKPRIGILSTGDEVVPADQTPPLGKIRDINSYTLAALVEHLGGIPTHYGIIPDNYNSLFDACVRALNQNDMLLISGGSSVGTRDYTIDVLSALPESKILFHGISISPGKPTILAKAGNKGIWGLPGHVVSAMIVFKIVVRPFIEHLSGLSATFRKSFKIPARLNRNIPSAQGRVDFVRVKLIEKNGDTWAEPILGKSGLIHTMVQADGLIEIDMNTEGLDKDAWVRVIPF